MATDCITQVTFQGDGFAKPVVARFDLPHASTDGGLVLVKALDRAWGLTERLAACLEDAREPGKVQHETLELLQQRVFGLCAGYADCNDAARLVHDPMHKLVLGRDPITGLGLASQPTLSRFENAVSTRELRAMTHVLADTVIAQQRRRLHGRATRITIDLDPTDDPTHGQQEFAFFNGHYDTWCYLPVVATVTFNDEPAQFAVAAVLRRGIIKAEVVRHPGRTPKNNPRFVVTNLTARPQTVYELYCQRGDVENRLKELHHGLEMDRTSCSKFRANQFRVLLTLAAYLLFQELRRRAAPTACADAQVTTLRERVIKLAVWVERSARRVVVHVPTTFPWLPTWRDPPRAARPTPSPPPGRVTRP